MTPLIFKHANTRRDVIVTREHIFLIQHSAAHAATHLISVGGAIIPVLETVDEATAKVYGTKPAPSATIQGEEVNGNA